MNIKVIQNEDEPSDLTGGEHGLAMLEISVDSKLSHRTKQGLIIHAVLENFFRSIEHNKVEECVDLIQEALDQLTGE